VILITQVLTVSPHLSSNGLSRIVYEHLSKYYIPKDSSLGFSRLFQVVVVHGVIFRSVALVLGVSILLVMAKDTSGLCPIAINDFFLTSSSLHHPTVSRAVSGALIPISIWNIEPWRL
jgi:hypothetical protein